MQKCGMEIVLSPIPRLPASMVPLDPAGVRQVISPTALRFEVAEAGRIGNAEPAPENFTLFLK
jgi:hypothetical protein